MSINFQANLWRTGITMVGGLLLTAIAHAQNLIIPQIADGGGWQTTIVLTNTSSSPQTAALSFFEETSGGATQSWNLAFSESANPQNLSLPGAGTIFLHSLGQGAVTNVGWAQVQAGSSVSAYAIFTQRVPGRQDQDGTATAAASSSRFLVPFDNTNGFVTTIAIANPNSSSQSIAAGIQTSGGTVSQASPMTIPANGHMSFALSQQISQTAGQSGLIEFYSAGGAVSILALRFNPTGAFTTAPVYSETGSPIIARGTMGSGSGASFPQFSTLTAGSDTASVFQTGSNVTVTLDSAGGQPVLCGAEVQQVNSYGALVASPFWSGYSINGLTVTCTGLISSLMANGSTGNDAQITSATLTFTLTPGTVNTIGTVSGSISLVSIVGTINTSFSGTYVASQ